jgi:Tfp pilus assembly protein PilV
MALRRGSRTARPEAGFALIEVVVSALIMVLTTGGVIKLLTATGHTSGEQRHRAQGFSLAQEDQARLRAIQISSLNTAMAARTVPLNGTSYTVTSKATFVNDTTSTTKCTGTSVSADYVKIGSKVTWPGMRGIPVILESIVSPVSGSLSPTNGSLAITVKNAALQGVPGVELNGIGAGTFNGYTDEEGCALFGGLPAGNYTLTPSAPEGYVDFNGEAPGDKPISVTAGTTSPIALEYDLGGSATLNFQVKSPSSSAMIPSSSDAVVAVNTGLQSGAKTFWTPTKLPGSSIAAEPLYPFTSSYSFYAGSCSENKPISATAEATSLVRPGGEETKIVTLPGLYLKVKNSSGVAISGARVTIKDNKCTASPKRVYATNASGALPDPGLPSSTSYAICASATVSGVGKVATTTKEVRNLTTGTTLELTLSTTGSACP